MLQSTDIPIVPSTVLLALYISVLYERYLVALFQAFAIETNHYKYTTTVMVRYAGHG
jgi:hypothetical protein